MTMTMTMKKENILTLTILINDVKYEIENKARMWLMTWRPYRIKNNMSITQANQKVDFRTTYYHHFPTIQFNN